MSLRLLIISTILILSPFTAFCQGGAAGDSYELPDVFAFGRKPLKSIGTQKISIDSAILFENVAQSLADILSQSTTLFVKSYGRATLSTAEFRGTSPAHTQVLWNGMRINSPMLGTVDFSMIPSFFIDNAALYSGPSSVNIISGGLGGAVNLSSSAGITDGLGMKYVQGIGSFDTYDQFLHFSYSTPSFSTSTRVDYATSKNDFKYTNYDKKVDVYENGVIVDSYHPKERNKSGYFHDLNILQEFHFAPSDAGDFNLSFWQTVSKRGLPFLSVDYKDDSDFVNEQKIKSSKAVASWNKGFGKLKVDVRTGFSHTATAYNYFTRRENIVVSDITKSRSIANSVNIKASAEYLPVDNFMASLTISGIFDHVKSHDRSTYHSGDNYNEGRWQKTASLSLRWRPWKRFAVASTVISESYGPRDAVIIPSLFAEFDIIPGGILSVKSSIARNYRYPSMDDLFFQPGGNPDLNPEKGFTYDGGVEWNVNAGKITLTGSLSAFDSHIDDWIQWVPDTRGFWRPYNVKKVHNYGIESYISLNLPLSKDWVFGTDGTFAWTSSINCGERVNENDNSYGKQLCYIPKFSASASARLSWKSWALYYRWNHYSERFTTTSNDVHNISGRLKPYYMSDMTIEKRFSFPFIRINVKGIVRNIFDSQYITVLSRPMPGRNFEIMFDFQPIFKSKHHKH